MNKEARLGLRLTPRTLKRLQAYARRYDKTVSDVVVAAIEEILKADDRAHGSVETVDAEQA